MQWQRAKEQDNSIRHDVKTPACRAHPNQARNVPTAVYHDSVLIYLDYLLKVKTRSVQTDTALTKMSLFETKTSKIFDKMVNYETFNRLQSPFHKHEAQFWTLKNSPGAR